MKKLILIIIFVCLFNQIIAYAQVNRAVAITNSDFRPGLQLMGGVGVNYNAAGFSGRGYIGLEGTFSIGSFGNRLNLEIAVRPSFQTDEYGDYGADIGFICPITLAPRLNICRVAMNSFYLYLQPEIGYAINADCIYGGRLGLGWKGFGSFYIDCLGSTKIMGEGTDYASNWLFGSVGYTLYFW